MAVKIRLSRIGRKKTPIYRIIAIDSRSKRDGKFLEDLGTYNPLTKQFVQYHAERFAYWLSQGAQPTDSVVKLQRMHKRLEAGSTAAS